MESDARIAGMSAKNLFIEYSKALADYLHIPYSMTHSKCESIEDIINNPNIAKISLGILE